MFKQEMGQVGKVIAKDLVQLQNLIDWISKILYN